MNYLLYLFTGASLYLVLHYLIFHSRLALYPANPKRRYRTGVSVIICARNEAENLKKYLPLVLDQDYKKYEVIVVNDGSTDQTAEVLQALKKKSRKLKVLNISAEESEPGKKSAIRQAIGKARNKYLLFTDADCEPASNNWLKSMSSHFRTKEIVLGFSPVRGKSSFTSLLATWESLLTAQQYLSFAISGIPYMGVGRNMGYTKGLFYNSDQFKGHAQLASGDDDLFIGQMATGINTSVEIAADTFCYTDAPKNFGAWWRQKRRHLSTSAYYRLHVSLLLGLFGLAQLLFYVLLILLFATGHQFIWVLTLMLIKFAVQLAVLLPAAVKLKQQNTLWFFPIWELLAALFLSLIHIQNLFSPRTKQWK